MQGVAGAGANNENKTTSPSPTPPGHSGERDDDAGCRSETEEESIVASIDPSDYSRRRTPPVPIMERTGKDDHHTTATNSHSEIQNTLPLLKSGTFSNPGLRPPPSHHTSQSTDTAATAPLCLPSTRSPRPSSSSYHRRELSSGSLRSYMSVVSAESTAHYAEFERLMSLPPYHGLAHSVSKFLEEAQRAGTGLLASDPRPYQIFMAHCVQAVLAIRDGEAVATPELRAGLDLQQRASSEVVVLEGIEKYLTTKLYRHLLTPYYGDTSTSSSSGGGTTTSTSADAENGRLLYENLQRRRHLDAAVFDAIPEVEEHGLWGQCMFELEAMKFFKSPREKLQCGVRALEMLQNILTDVLRERKEGIRQSRVGNMRAALPSPVRGDECANETMSGNHSNNNSTADETSGFQVLGADEILPCFMLLVLRASPTLFYENVTFIERFRTHALLTPGESYCLANLESAVQFWMYCDETGHMAPPPPPGSTSNHSFASSAGLSERTNKRRSPSPRQSLSLLETVFGKAPTRRQPRLTNPPQPLPASPSPPAAPPLHTGDAPLRIPYSSTEVRRWLVEENIPFELLTVTQLRGIVEVTRELFR